jgi:hypothetical protein
MENHMGAQSVAFIAILMFTVPAAAQFYPAPGPGPHRSPPMIATTISQTRSIAPQIGRVYSDIDQGRSAGQLSRKQAKQLRIEAEEIGILEQRYAVDGLSDSEAAELNTRIEALVGVINAERSGGIK